MLIAQIILWTLLVLFTLGALAVSIVSLRADARWFALPAIGAVLATLALNVFGIHAPFAALAVLNGIGLLGLAVVAGSPLVSIVLRLAGGGDIPLGAHGGILVGGESRTATDDREILRGGETIGYLERFALVGCVVAGQPGGVAVIVAIKGLGRFNELENAFARERFIIGTLASLTWAGLCAAAIALTWAWMG